jgi:hypothetical protein
MQQIRDLWRHFLFDDAAIHPPNFVTYTNSDSTSEPVINIIRTDCPFIKRIPHGTNSIRMPPASWPTIADSKSFPPIRMAALHTAQFPESEYRAKAWEYLSLAENMNGPEQRADTLQFAKMWMSLSEPMGDVPVAYKLPRQRKRYQWSPKPESFTAARTAIDGCSLVNPIQGAFLSGTSLICGLAEKRPTLKLVHSSVNGATGLSTWSCCA